MMTLRNVVVDREYESMDMLMMDDGIERLRCRFCFCFCMITVSKKSNNYDPCWISSRFIPFLHEHSYPYSLRLGYDSDCSCYIRALLMSFR